MKSNQRNIIIYYVSQSKKIVSLAAWITLMAIHRRPIDLLLYLHAYFNYLVYKINSLQLYSAYETLSMWVPDIPAWRVLWRIRSCDFYLKPARTSTRLLPYPSLLKPFYGAVKKAGKSNKNKIKKLLDRIVRYWYYSYFVSQKMYQLPWFIRIT